MTQSNTYIHSPQTGNSLPWTHPGIDVVVDATMEFIFLLNATVSGYWTLRLTGVATADRYRVEVAARSLVDFTYLLMEEDGTGTLVPISGIPLAGEIVKFL